MSSSKRTDLCVPGVFTASGVAFEDMEYIEDVGEVDPDTKEAAIANVGDELAKCVRCRVPNQGRYIENSLYAPQPFSTYALVLN
jgi:hypothetical protein